MAGSHLVLQREQNHMHTLWGDRIDAKLTRSSHRHIPSRGGEGEQRQQGKDLQLNHRETDPVSRHRGPQ